MELKRCLGLIILEIILKVTIPPMLFAGKKGKRSIFEIFENPDTFFFLAHTRHVRFLIFHYS